MRGESVLTLSMLWTFCNDCAAENEHTLEFSH